MQRLALARAAAIAAGSMSVGLAANTGERVAAVLSSLLDTDVLTAPMPPPSTPAIDVLGAALANLSAAQLRDAVPDERAATFSVTNMKVRWHVHAGRK